MGKKKIIITRKQFKKLNEVDLSVAASQNTGAAYGVAVNNADTRNQLRTLKQNSGEDTGAMVIGPNSNENSGVVHVEVPKGKSPADVITQDPGISKAIEGGARALVTGPGFPMGESARYTKKQLEEARLQNIRRNGKVTTKAKLFEDTLGSQRLSLDEIDELRKFCASEEFFMFFMDQRLGRINHNLINNAESLRQQVVYDLTVPNYRTVEYTDEIDYYVDLQIGSKIDLDTCKTVKVVNTTGETYYIIWEGVKEPSNHDEYDDEEDY